MYCIPYIRIILLIYWNDKTTFITWQWYINVLIIFLFNYFWHSVLIAWHGVYVITHKLAVFVWRQDLLTLCIGENSTFRMCDYPNVIVTACHTWLHFCAIMHSIVNYQQQHWTVYINVYLCFDMCTICYNY